MEVIPIRGLKHRGSGIAGACHHKVAMEVIPIRGLKHDACIFATLLIKPLQWRLSRLGD